MGFPTPYVWLGEPTQDGSRLIERRVQHPERYPSKPPIGRPTQHLKDGESIGASHSKELANVSIGQSSGIMLEHRVGKDEVKGRILKLREVWAAVKHVLTPIPVSVQPSSAGQHGSRDVDSDAN